MIELKTLIEEIFEELETIYHPKWNKGLGSKQKLITALSQTELLPYKFLGYSCGSGMSKAILRSIPELRGAKGNKKTWRDYFLEQKGYFLCASCLVLFSLEDKIKGDKHLCKPCEVKRTKLRNTASKRKLYGYLLEHPCVDCGVSDPVFLEFDHLDPSIKEHNIGNLVGYKWETILKEIDKCEVVCANCHRKRTAKLQNWYGWL